jgi:hypothetical protein
MPTVELIFPTPHINQQAILDDRTRFRVAACGRRFGKTEVGKREIVLAALHGKKCWWLAPTYRMATETWQSIKHFLRPLDSCVVSDSERMITLPTGGSIAVRSTHEYHNLRGAGLDFAVLDEAAFMHPDVWPQIVRPMLGTTQGDALFLSSPFGRNHFWDLFQLGQDPLKELWKSFHFTSYDNPDFKPAELADIQSTTPERIWREEYMAEFIDDAGAVFRNVRACAITSELLTAEPMAKYIIGVDLGKSNDFTVFTVMNPTTRRVVYVDRMREVDYTLQLSRLRALCEKFPPQTVIIEDNIGEMFIEQAKRAGLPVQPFHTSAQTKALLIDRLSIAFERGEIAILNEGKHWNVVVNELLSYQLERLPAGGFRYSAPEGQHDDTVISLALAWHGVANRVMSFSKTPAVNLYRRRETNI